MLTQLMRLLLTGASGFLGSAVGKRLAESGHELRVLGRRVPPWLPAGSGFHRWDAMTGAAPAEALDGVDAVLHLAGEPVAQRWTKTVKRRIQRSRVEGTRALVEAISRLESRPKMMVAASAIGYYGDRGDEDLTEESGAGAGFLAEVCAAWEQETLKAAELGLRVSRVRFGVVLGRKGGALAKMLPAFRAGLGGPIGKGRQWMSWIHVADAVGMLKFILETPGVGGLERDRPDAGPERGVQPRAGQGGAASGGGSRASIRVADDVWGDGNDAHGGTACEAGGGARSGLPVRVSRT